MSQGSTRRSRSTKQELLTATEVIARLGISRGTFYGDRTRNMPGLRNRLRARGLEIVRIPSMAGNRVMVRYVAASLDKIIKAAASKESLLC